MRLTADSGWAAVSIRDIAAAASLSDLESAGALRPTADAAACAAFLLVNDLAVVLLQDQVAACWALIRSAGAGLRRWETR